MEEPLPPYTNGKNTSTTSSKGTHHPIYHGVRKRQWGKWVSEIREPKKKTRIWLGSYPKPEMAARAYDVAAYCLKGKKAQLNFPKEIENWNRPLTKAPRDIQAASALAAKMVSDKSVDVKNVGDIDDFWTEIELPELRNDCACPLSEPEVWYWNSTNYGALSANEDAISLDVVE